MPQKLEGFICPQCKKELDSIFDLQNHFLTVHSSTNNETDQTPAKNRNSPSISSKSLTSSSVKNDNSTPNTLSSIDSGNPNSSNQQFFKESDSDQSSSQNATVYTRTKTTLRKVTNINKKSSKQISSETPSKASEIQNINYSEFTTTGGIDVLQYKKQLIGQYDDQQINKHFKKTRSSNITRIIAQENKLLLRLEKLLKVINLEKSSRRNFETSIVPWVPDKDVPFCPGCGSKFGLFQMNFPHHCRLCGCIMCENCILGMKFENVLKILKGCNVPSAMNFERRVGSDDYFYKICGYCNEILQNKYWFWVLII